MTLLNLAGLAVAGLVGLAVVEASIRRSSVGAVLVLAAFLLETYLWHVELAIFLGPFRISLNDVVFVILITATAARLLRLQRLTTPQRLLMLFSALIVWSLVRGALTISLTDSVNNARSFLGFMAAALYFSTVEARRDLLDRIGTLWLGAALALAFLVLLRWAAYVAGISSGILGQQTSLRVIAASTTLILAQGALIALPWLLDQRRGFLRLVGPTLLVFVVLLQHRTVWVVTIVGVIYLLWRERALNQRMLAGLLASAAVFFVLVVTVFQGQDDEIAEQLSESAQDTRTFEWRVQGWTAIMRDSGPEGPTEWLVGRPMGSGWDRVLPNGWFVDVSPHNYYIEALLRVGVIGLATILAVYAIALRGTADAHPDHGFEPGLLTPNVLHVVIAVQLVYFIPYSPDMAQAMLLGLGCAVSVGSRGPAYPVLTGSEQNT